MKKSIFTLMLALLCCSLWAKPVDVATAKSLGIKFMKANTEIKADVAQLTYTAYTDQGVACFYVFTMQPKGFVIVSADDRSKPILGYSTESGFDADEIPDGLQSFFNNYQAGFSQMMAANEERTAEAERDWNRLAETGRINDAKITRVVPKLLTTIWNQSALYNDLCPFDTLGPNNHVYAGCVATAMSQIMNYHHWPQTGMGWHTDATPEYGNLTVYFSDATYRYELMPDYLDWTSSPEEIHAIAQLQYHAGVSVDMMYSPEGSGAFSQDVVDALVFYFNYDEESIDINYRDWYTDSEWNVMLRENLDMDMPLYYSAQGPDGGHAFVCDGYDDSDMFHFNWGWQGLDNGYYPINGFYLSNYSFPDFHAAIFGIYPNLDICYRPLPVTDLEIEAVSSGTNHISFTAPSMTACDFALDEIDSIVIIRNNVIVHTEKSVAGGSQVVFDDHDALGIGHYVLTPYSYGFVGDFTRDTILNGPTCEVEFHLHDSVGDGWIAKSIAIVDSHGNPITRLGLAEGSDAIVKVEVPSDDELRLHWAYSIGGKDRESYFELYKWDGNLIYATHGRPFVGELCRFYTDCYEAVSENNESLLTLYPNPTNAQVTIEGVEVAQVEVYNALGQQVRVSHQQVVDLSALESGMYFLRVTSTEGQVWFEKVLKQ